jgi:hypothetical protein
LEKMLQSRCVRKLGRLIGEQFGIPEALALKNG